MLANKLNMQLLQKQKHCNVISKFISATTDNKAKLVTTEVHLNEGLINVILHSFVW